MASTNLPSIIKEALIRSGYARPDTDLLARAETWVEEIKADLWAKSRKLKSLQSRAFTLLTQGRNIYSNPSDYSSDMKMRYATGQIYGTATGGTISTIVMAAATSTTEDELVGKEILITSNTGSGGWSQITAYNDSTKTATVSPSFSTAPAAGSGYVVLDSYDVLEERPNWDQGNDGYPSRRGTPEKFFPQGGTDTGQFILWPTPKRNDTQPMVVLHDYYADLTLIDDTTDLMDTILRRWKTLWMAGIRWKMLQEDNDDRSAGAYQEYALRLRDVISAETYGHDMASLRPVVTDY